MSLTAPSAARRTAEAERRLRILVAAERAFVGNGFHATTMQHVADEAGMSAGNLYRYFPSKEAIVEGLCELDQAELAQAFGELMADNRQIMEAMRWGLRKHVLAKPPEKARLLVEIWAEAGRNPRVAAMSRAIDAEVRARLVKLIDAAKAVGAASPRLDFPFRRPVLCHLRRRPIQANRARRRFQPGSRDADGDRRSQGAARRGAVPGSRGAAAAAGALMRRALIVSLVVGAAALGGVFAAVAVAPCALPSALMAKIAPDRSDACPVSAEAAVDQPRAVEPPAVTVVPAVKREFVDRLFVSGTLVAREEAQVASRIDGLTIVEVDAEDGDRVKQGQVLARLDRSQLDAMLAENDAATKRADAAIDQARSLIAQSQAQEEFAASDFDRARKLGQGVMAASTIEQREMAMKTAEAQLAASQNALGVAEADRKSRDAERQELLVRIDRTEVKAPVSGVISRRSAKPGAAASSAGEPLFRIIEDGAIDLEADVPEQSLARLAVGMRAELKLPGVEDPVSGRVRLVNEEVDRASRTGKVRIALEDVSHAHIGAFASGEVELTRRDGLSAPASALTREGDSARLDVVRDGKVEERQVTPGIVNGEAVEIKQGLAGGESIVARAAAFLRPGDRVRPTPEASAAGG